MSKNSNHLCVFICSLHIIGIPNGNAFFFNFLKTFLNLLHKYNKLFLELTIYSDLPISPRNKQRIPFNEISNLPLMSFNEKFTTNVIEVIRRPNNHV